MTDRVPFLPVPDRVAFTIPKGIPLIGGLDIMWYGILLTLGIVAGFMVLYKKAPKRGIDKERMLDLVLWSVPAAIIGARLYYCIFEWEYYKDDLSSIFDIRAGGLAIHGGVIGGFGVALICLLIWKIDVLDCFDNAVQGLVLGQAIGRWGNYFNSEAHGGPTDLPWAIYCDGEFVHPTFLYESLWCVLLFLFLLWFDKNKAKYKGQCICLYSVIYSVERFFVEGLRTDSLWVKIAGHSFRQAQIISVVMMVCGIIGLIVISKNKERLKIEKV